MSYFRLDIGTGIIGVFLVLVSVLFAWSRSLPAPPAVDLVSSTPGQTAPQDLERLGAEVYAAECVSCHREGEQRGQMIPALREFAVELFVAEGGRDALIDFMLDGRVRRAAEGETSARASHPEYAELSDEQLAAVLNHMLTSWGNADLLPETPALYTPGDAASRR